MCQNAGYFSSRIFALLTLNLDHLRLIRVSGADRASFLQGQLTQDLRLVRPDRSALYGWATAQGRLLACGQLFEWREALWLTVPAAAVDALLPRLRRFVLRAKVTVDASAIVLAGLAGPATRAAFTVGGATLGTEPFTAVSAGECLLARCGGDPGRVLVLGERDAARQLLGAPGTAEGDSADWRLADVRAGLPWIEPGNSETFIPQMVNLDLIGAVSFDKGCYTGQEIVTRTRHLGRVKRRMLRFACEATTPPVAGEPIFGSEREAGRVVTAARAPSGVELLAVTAFDEPATPLFLDAGRRLALRRLDLPYSVA